MEQGSTWGQWKRERSKEHIITGMNRKSGEIIQHYTERELKSAKKPDKVSVKRYHKEAFGLPFSLWNVDYWSCKLVELKQALYRLDYSLSQNLLQFSHS